MRNVLITGGAGFIGSHLCERLVARGDHVIVLDDLSSGRRANLRGVEPAITFIQDDVCNVLAHADALRDVSCVYHLAALISGYDSLHDPDAYVRTNVTGVLRLVELCRRLKRPRVVFASSSTVYGSLGDPLRSETTPPRPITMYALSKLAGEHILDMYRDLAGYDDVTARLFNVYGPRQSPDHPYANVTCKFSHAAAHALPVRLYGDGSQSRDFVFVTDVVDALLALERASAHRIYNVGTSADRSIGELLALVQKLAATEIAVERCPPWPNDIRAIRADTTRLRDETGFAPRVDLEAGLERTIAYFREMD